jgi:hypothetical protein
MSDLPDGYLRISGKRNPPEGTGAYFVVLRCGHMPDEPWPSGKTASGQVRWKWGEKYDDWDVIAVKPA